MYSTWRAAPLALAVLLTPALAVNTAIAAQATATKPEAKQD